MYIVDTYWGSSFIDRAVEWGRERGIDLGYVPIGYTPRGDLNWNQVELVFSDPTDEVRHGRELVKLINDAEDEFYEKHYESNYECHWI